ncbi:MAG: pantoate--beta-alanine ligase [Gammaproteobacteria bacterium RIFCSPLOWO2_02_47_7]|nr:MAG: pantoate--beta-alanine ligase [Gammaproteobacteria bacterium RIFCSPLOWO2_02_47_7]
MLEIDRIFPLREQLSSWRQSGQSIALVPTMGNLHAGHLSLVDKAKTVADRVVVTIFVNSIQFVAGEDFASYPRTIGQDRAKLAAIGTDILFHPLEEEIFPESPEQHTTVMVPSLDNIFCGKFRPGHFAGVATVVAKLLNIIQPDVAVFGEKDYQQLLVIKQLVRDLSMPVRIIDSPTVRESDGLAMSSRNIYLNAEERMIAPMLFQVLSRMKDEIINGNSAYTEIEQRAQDELGQAGFATEYVAIRAANNLAEAGTGDLVVLAAARLGTARLIDNVVIRR